MKKYLAIIAALFACALASAKQDIKSNLFRAGDNVCLVGDSITAGGQFSNHLMLYYATRFPNAPMNFFNLGISGDTCSGILWRMDWDILEKKPSVCILMVGMNDVGRNRFSAEGLKSPDLAGNVESARVSYEEKLEKIVNTLSENSRSLVIFTPSIYDQTADLAEENYLGVNDELGVYGEIGRKLGEKTKNSHTVDMNLIMGRVNALHQKLKGKDATIIGADRVHPRAFGGFVMANIFLESFNEPAYVSEMSIDAKAKALEKAFNCEVKNLQFDGGKISFSALEEALPFPVGDEERPALDYFDFNQNFNREILRVAGLPYGNYVLKIDGKEAGKYSHADFWKGVNLAENASTPQYAQALEVAKLCEEFRSRAGGYRGMFRIDMGQRNIMDGMKSLEEKIEYVKKKLAEEEAGAKRPYYISGYKYYIAHKADEKKIFDSIAYLQKKIHAAARPKAHAYEIEKL